MSKKIIVFLLMLSCGLVVLGIRSNLLLINKVEVFPPQLECVNSDQVIQSSKLLGKNILTINRQQVVKELLSQYLCIKQIRLHYQFPRQIRLELEARSPLIRVVKMAGLVVDHLSDLESSPSSQTALLDWSVTLPTSASSYLVVDSDGVIYGQTEDLVTPLLLIPKTSDIGVIADNFKLGQRLDPVVVGHSAQIFQGVIEIIGESSTYGLNQLKAKVMGHYLLLDYHPKVAFSLITDIQKQIASLQLLLQKAKIDGREMSLIDLRFDRPVVVYSKK